LIGSIAAASFGTPPKRPRQGRAVEGQWMHSVLKSVLGFLIAAAFGFASIGTATASPCAERSGQMLQAAVGPGPTLDCKPTASELTHHHSSPHETHDQRLHRCCVSTTAAAPVEVVRPYAALRVESDAFPISNGKVLTGIAIAPLTGPPKLSA
jgi:hypothetical protein